MSENDQLDPKLLELMACPKCKEAIRQEGAWIVCDKCAKKYPIRENIPIMLLDEAQDL